VSHHPPVLALNCVGKGWELQKNLHNSIKFTGRNVTCEDHNPTIVDLQLLNGRSENYSLKTPKLIVGNLIMGERYIEPIGKVTCHNTTLGIKCILDFKARPGMFSKEDTTNAIKGFIYDADDNKRFKIFGKFSSKIEAINLETDE